MTTTYRVMSWRDIPSQVKATDDTGDSVSKMLPGPFQAEIDRVAVAKGLIGTDEYLEAWHWSEGASREGSAEEVAQAVLDELVARGLPRARGER